MKLIGYINPSRVFPSSITAVIRKNEATYLVLPDGTIETAVVSQSSESEWLSDNDVVLATHPIDIAIEPGDCFYAISETDLLIGRLDAILSNLSLRLAFWQGSKLDGLQLARTVGEREIANELSVEFRSSITHESARRLWDQIQAEDAGAMSDPSQTHSTIDEDASWAQSVVAESANWQIPHAFYRAFEEYAVDSFVDEEADEFGDAVELQIQAHYESSYATQQAIDETSLVLSE